MKAFVIAAIAATLSILLAGCSGMGMHQDSSGGMNATGTSASSDGYTRQHDVFRSWVD